MHTMGGSKAIMYAFVCDYVLFVKSEDWIKLDTHMIEHMQVKSSCWYKKGTMKVPTRICANLSMSL